MARQLKEVNWKEVEKRIEAGNSAKQIAASIPVEINTFYDRFKLEYGNSFADYADTFRSRGPANIAFVQYMKALGGSIPMLILLGKEWLKQGQEEETFKSLLRKDEENSKPSQIIVKVSYDGLGAGLSVSTEGLPDTTNQSP